MPAIEHAAPTKVEEEDSLRQDRCSSTAPASQTAPSVERHMTLAELREAGLGHGGFDLGYGRVRAGDLVEGGVDRYHTGQVLEVFHDGDCWVQWDDEPATATIKWRLIRKIGDAPVPPTGPVSPGSAPNTDEIKS